MEDIRPRRRIQPAPRSYDINDHTQHTLQVSFTSLRNERGMKFEYKQKWCIVCNSKTSYFCPWVGGAAVWYSGALALTFGRPTSRIAPSNATARLSALARAQPHATVPLIALHACGSKAPVFATGPDCGVNTPVCKATLRASCCRRHEIHPNADFRAVTPRSSGAKRTRRVAFAALENNGAAAPVVNARRCLPRAVGMPAAGNRARARAQQEAVL